jgi:cation diffusion facilitator family transporter
MEKHRLSRGVRATLLGMVTNAALAGVKLVAGVAGHSQALVADAVESLADLLSSAIVWRGIVVASTPADSDHPYGHGKAEPLASAAVAILLVMAAAWIAIASLRGMVHPSEVPEAYTLGVLAVVVVIKELLFRRVLQEGEAIESSAVRSDAWHHRSDAITSLAAGLGISVALVGGPSYAAADNMAAVIAAGVIAWNAWRILRPALNELMDAEVGAEVVKQIAREAAAVEEVADVEQCRVRKTGYRLLVDMHVEVRPSMTVECAHLVAHEVKDRICTRFPEVLDVLVHVEPAGQKQRQRRTISSSQRSPDRV